MCAPFSWSVSLGAASGERLARQIGLPQHSVAERRYGGVQVIVVTSAAQADANCQSVICIVPVFPVKRP